MKRSLLAALGLRIAAGVVPAILLVLVWPHPWFAVPIALVAIAWIALQCRALVEQALPALAPRADSDPLAASTTLGIAPIDAPFEEMEPLARAIEAQRMRMTHRLDETAELQRRLELVLDSMQDYVVSVDPAQRITWSNKPMRRHTGIFGLAYRGNALVQSIREPEVLECVRIALEERTVAERPAVAFPAGRIFAVSAAPMDGGGAVIVLRDVTRIIQMERTQKEFVANVSHELRTPLTSILGYVELLIDEARWEDEAAEEGEAPASPASGSKGEFLEAILKSAQRMERLTEDLLVMAKVDAGDQKLHPEPVKAAKLIEEAVAATAGALREDVQLEVMSVVDATVSADLDAMLQVLGNLIENAINYGTKHGAAPHVTVSAERAAAHPGMVVFSVRDFGAGIALEHRERIFERFYRADKTRSRETGGTGLGLSIARNLVESHGGTIWVETELGHGSCFRFTLPEVPAPTKTRPQPAAAEAAI